MDSHKCFDIASALMQLMHQQKTRMQWQDVSKGKVKIFSSISCALQAARSELEGAQQSAAELNKRLSEEQRESARAAAALQEAMQAHAQRADAQRCQLEAALSDVQAEQEQASLHIGYHPKATENKACC